MPALYLPTDVVTGSPIDVDLAADYLELTAFFAADGAARTSDLANAASIGAAGRPPPGRTEQASQKGATFHVTSVDHGAALSPLRAGHPGHPADDGGAGRPFSFLSRETPP